ncbi:unnamed protein product [Mytilus edulis]|uniref:Uncharacterized protein n=1 Tax=Mytilus edulis TaxID=6550 RepID=A0A8S3T350_MYTED|nr:unnamed protein product [Mytilus edulis]
MPRRRKSLHNNKAPLIFTESPVNIQSNVPSPVYCSRHPLTAKSVPVGDLSWVSPQFSGNQASTRKVKKQRKRRSTSGSKCTCHHGSHGNPTGGASNKYEPLKFFGEKTPPVTIVEDLSFSEEEENVNISQETKSPCLNRAETALKRKSRSKRKSLVLKRKLLSENDLLVKQTGDQDNSDDNFDLGNHRNTSFHTPVTNIIPRVKAIIRNDLTEVDGIQPESDDFNGTPVNKIPSPVKRLFTSLQESPETNVFTLIKNRKSSKANKDMKNKPNRLLKNLNTSVYSPSGRNNNGHVLVADTPEADYGIPYRLRRLRKIRTKCNI